LIKVEVICTKCGASVVLDSPKIVSSEHISIEDFKDSLDEWISASPRDSNVRYLMCPVCGEVLNIETIDDDTVYMG
jgi:predicted RNA-binding Zn-ribbon protein involved in translation (DUF1610 family)